ncbi:MAG: T9SS type A sorting domain-containing protein, partial [Bacteroidales bacterium]|nr:T9SS type A sorting domain-containing protein [Bacteroidales bacterium]
AFVAYFALNNYTVTVISANDSMGTVSGGGTYEAGSQVTITATAAEGCRFVSWNDGNTDNPRTITVTEDATYIATFEEGVGIESRDMLSELTFYPNPTSGIITLSRTDVMKVEVIDAVGKTIMVVANNHVLDLSKLTKGYYTLRITLPEGVAVRKVIRK